MLTKSDLQAIDGLIEKRLKPIGVDINGLKDDVSGLKEDVSNLEQDMSEMKADVGGLKEDVKIMKRDTSSLKLGQKKLNDKTDLIIKTLDKDVMENRKRIVRLEDKTGFNLN